MTKLWLLLIALSAPLLLLMCGDSEPDEPIVPTPTASATATPLPIVTRMSAATPAPRATRPAKPTPEPSPTPTPTVDDVAALATISPEEVFAAAFEAMAKVKEGSPIIVVGQNGLKDGTRVRVVNEGWVVPKVSAEAASDAEG